MAIENSFIVSGTVHPFISGDVLQNNPAPTQDNSGLVFLEQLGGAAIIIGGAVLFACLAVRGDKSEGTASPPKRTTSPRSQASSRPLRK